MMKEITMVIIITIVMLAFMMMSMLALTRNEIGMKRINIEEQLKNIEVQRLIYEICGDRGGHYDGENLNCKH